MPYVQRDGLDRIVGIYAQKQPGYAEEWADEAQAVLAPAVTDYSTAIQQHLDAASAARGYDGIHSAVSYRNDPNAAFAEEGEAAFLWRSAVWTYAIAELEKVNNGQRGAPAIEAFLSELPQIEWPEIAE